MAMDRPQFGLGHLPLLRAFKYLQLHSHHIHSWIKANQNLQQTGISSKHRIFSKILILGIKDALNTYHRSVTCALFKTETMYVTTWEVDQRLWQTPEDPGSNPIIHNFY